MKSLCVIINCSEAVLFVINTQTQVEVSCSIYINKLNVLLILLL